MSLSKELCSRSDSQNSDSFSDRICDDLSEVILQYLSLEDRFRLECVSKQFQRTVFRSLKQLELDDSDFWATQILDTLAKKSRKFNCLQKLRSLSIADISDFGLLLPVLKAFPALKRLNFTEINSIFSFKTFKGLSNITHLTLQLNSREYITLNEKMLKQINFNLPNLQYLEITDTFDTTPEGVQQMAYILSRLSRLETLKLEFESGVDFKPIEEQITKKCRKIKTIDIKIH